MFYTCDEFINTFFHTCLSQSKLSLCFMVEYIRGTAYIVSTKESGSLDVYQCKNSASAWSYYCAQWTEWLNGNNALVSSFQLKPGKGGMINIIRGCTFVFLCCMRLLVLNAELTLYGDNIRYEYQLNYYYDKSIGK